MPSVATVLLALASVVVVSGASLIGLAALSLSKSRLRKATTVWVAFAAGALLGDAFIHLIPEVLTKRTAEGKTLQSSLLILSGMVLFFIVEKLLRHHHGPIHEHFHHPSHEHSPAPLATVNLIGDAIHNFIDGVLIGTSYLASPMLGLSTTMAVLLHEVPQEMGDFGVLVHSGLSVRNAVRLNLLVATTALLGTVLGLLLGAAVQETVLDVALPIAAGGFVYLAAATLIPELQHDKSPRSIVLHSALMIAGILVMGSLKLLE